MADDHPMAAGTCKEHNLWSNPAPITPELAARLQRLAEALEDLAKRIDDFLCRRPRPIEPFTNSL